jgi:two-component system sensor histidine kinase YesM
MKRLSSDLEKRVKVSFLIGVFIIVSLLLATFYVVYRVNLEKQQMYSLNQNYTQNYEGISSNVERMEKLSRQFSVGLSLEMMQIFGEDSLKDDMAMFEDLTEYTNTLEFSMGDISIFYYIDDDFVVVHQNGLHYRPIKSIESEDWYEKLKENNGRNTWFSFQKDEYFPENKTLSLARYITDSNDYRNQIGVLVFSMDTSTLLRSFTKITEQQVMYLADENGTIIASSEALENNPKWGQESNSQSSMDAYEVWKNEQGKFLIRRCEIDDTGIYLVSLVPYEYMGAIYKSFLFWVLGGYFLILLLAAFYISFMSKRLTIPLKKLAESISTATVSGKLECLEIDSTEKEICTLVDAYNMLIQKIEILLKQQYSLGKEKQQAELMALQSQINPHFLYNTLEMVNWMAERNEKENVQTVIQKMSTFYRLVLSKGKDIVTIREELALCETYLTIQQMRFQGRIQYERDVDDEILDYLIPKITLQPFVENAILHGIIASIEGRGTLSINGWEEDGRIILAVMDDGAGMAEEDREKSNSKGSHYGMKNIGLRLSVYYQEDIKIEVESTKGVGTCVSINIPMWPKDTKRGAE